MKIRFVCLIAFLVCLQSQPAQAQKIFEQFNKPMPKLTLLPEAEFVDKTTLVNETAPGDPALAYTFRLPKDWIVPKDTGTVSLASGNNILGEIGRFYGPSVINEERSLINVNSHGIDYKMSAQQWLMQHVLAKGYNVQGMHVADDTSAEALYIFIKEGESYVTRALAKMNGKRVIFLQYSIPIDRWHNEKILQAQVISTFKLTNPVQETVEPLKEYKFLDIASIQYPETWQLNAPTIKTIDRMGVKLMNLGKIIDKFDQVKTKLDGKIEMEMVSIFTTESLEKEIEKYRSKLEKNGLVVGQFIEAPEDLVLNPHFDFAETNVFSAADSGNKLIAYEFWQTVLSSGDYYYFVSLLTPARDQDYFIWSRNTQTYKLILNLMKPLENTMTED